MWYHPLLMSSGLIIIHDILCIYAGCKSKENFRIIIWLITSYVNFNIVGYK